MIATTRFDDGWKGVPSGLGDAYRPEVSCIADRGQRHGGRAGGRCPVSSNLDLCQRTLVIIRLCHRSR